MSDAENMELMKIAGDFKIRQVPEFFDTAKAHIESGKPLTIDLSEVSKIDCSGLQMLCYLRKSFSQRNVDLQLIDPSEAVADVVDFVQMREQLNFSQRH